MKIFILLSFLFITSFVVNAQEESVDITQDITQAERIIDKYTAQVTTSINSIVDDLKEPAKEVFETVVKLQIAKGIIYLFFATICFILLILCCRYYNYLSNNNDHPGAALLIAICIGGLIPFSYHSILLLSSPKWFAILELTNLVK